MPATCLGIIEFDNNDYNYDNVTLIMIIMITIYGNNDDGNYYDNNKK
mgnify:CR=1 FL=1